ncbi:hypothetical protein SynBIOSE41_03452 [Synechococcus sp. BIOS-E4-1]|nr:hypothetical protein SynBIOSE41_03452 [Synechococcus sp. BIOS-E4-1]
MEQGPEVSLLLRSALVECQLSKLLRSRQTYFRQRTHIWQPAILLIAFTGKKSNSEDGLPKLR